MRKLILLLFAATVFSATAFAKGKSSFLHFGVEGGLSVNNYTDLKELNTKKPIGWHAGVSLLCKLPLSFALQPAVIYERSNSNIPGGDGGVSTLNVDAINIPVSLQWGPDLGICRIFAEAVPIVGFNLGARLNNSDDMKDFLKTAQFGIGAGLGVDIWRFQLSARYSWTFGDWQTVSSIKNPFEGIPGHKNGLMVTLAFFFN